MAKILNKILAGIAGFFALLSGFFALLFQHEKKKQIKEQLIQNEKELQKIKEGNKEYVQYKKENAEIVNDAISGDPDALLRLMQNNTEAGKHRTDG